MTATPPTASSPRHRLETFGTLALSGSNGSELGNRASQRRRLALLAVLAAAGERGRSRDELLLLFWPDVTQVRARHSLEQLVYSIRSSLDKDVFIGVNPVRLNHEVVASDVGEFNDAIARSDLAAAVRTYRGPFLNGFYLGDAPEFEQWADAQRAQLERAYSAAVEQLAVASDAAGDPAAAVRWWRTLTEIDPISAKYSSGLMRALMNGGDHATALQHAERYAAVVRREVGTDVGPAVADLVAEVRERSKAGSVRSPARRASPPHPQAESPAGVTRDVGDISDQPSAARPVPHAPSAEASEKASSPTPPPRPGRRRTPYLLGAFAILLIVTAAGLHSMRQDPAPPVAARPSIAVLPLANVSGDPVDAALVDGLSEELIAALASIRDLRVIARTSAFSFRNSDLGVPAIADSLGVTNVLEGSARRSGSQLRVQVRLVDARDGSTRWSETYDREVKDIFAVQSDIATAVARQLELRLSESSLRRVRRGATTNVAAYELYLRANDPRALRSDSAALAALENFEQAIALDSLYAGAYAGLARMHMRVGSGGLTTTAQRRERLALAEAAALKAVALDDSLGDAHAALGIVRRNTGDLAAAEGEFKRAIALEPAAARFHEWLVQTYIMTERPEEALATARRALELDPLSPTATAEMAHAFLANDRCDAARTYLDRLADLRPPLLRARFISAQCFAREGKWPEAIAEARFNAPNAGHGLAQLGNFLARDGRRDEARAVLAQLIEHSRRTNSGAFEVATVYAGLGEHDEAFAWLDRAFEDRSINFWNLPTVLGDLPPGPRLHRFRARLGLQNR